jgi:hypothetical protein
MNPEQLYQHLVELADKLGISVLEQSFKQAGLPVKSEHCRVKGKDMFIMDRTLSPNKKSEALILYLKDQPHENIFIPPAVREFLGKKHKKLT